MPDTSPYCVFVAETAALTPALGVVVVAASFGGLPVLQSVLATLPADFPVPVLVVQHRSPQGPDVFAELLAARAALPVTVMRHGEQLTSPGVRVLPVTASARIGPGHTLLLSERVRHPADELMSSVADQFGSRCCAIVLTGRLDDGTHGVRAVKRAGGKVLVQDPRTARAPGMPQHALATGCVDLVLPPPVIGPALIALALAPGAWTHFTVPPAPWANLATG
jgi:two-component system chemotaxis response regulator CheB